MEDSLFNQMPGLQKLLETRSFPELTGSEQEEVLKVMNQDAYDAYHEVIMQSKIQFGLEQKTLAPDPSTGIKLLSKMEGRKSRRTVLWMLQELFTIRIPAYQPAFVLAVLVVLFFVLKNTNHETIRYSARTDTVYLDKKTPTDMQTANQPPSEKAHPAGTGIKASNKSAHSATKNEHAVHFQNDQYVMNVYKKIQLTSRSKCGQSAADDSALMKFLVVAN